MRGNSQSYTELRFASTSQLRRSCPEKSAPAPVRAWPGRSGGSTPGSCVVRRRLRPTSFLLKPFLPEQMGPHTFLDPSLEPAAAMIFPSLSLLLAAHLPPRESS